MGGEEVATLTIRAIDDELKARLRERAATNGRSMEAEVRAILRAAVLAPPVDHVGTRIAERFAALGGVELDLPAREERMRPPGVTG